ncbi:peptide deformylase [bacterium]|nr:peptide deformylase [bacterium]
MIVLRKDKLKLVPSDDPILHNPPEEFDFAKEGVGMADRLFNLLCDRCKEIGGIGLAANQVGINTRVFVMGLDEIMFGIFNPVIVEYSDQLENMDEGCLSFPGMSLNIKRPGSIVATYKDSKGKEFTNRFEGLSARVFQHEYDHMIGKTFKSHVSQLKWNLAVKKKNHVKQKLVKKYSDKILIDIYNEAKIAENRDLI